MARTRFNELDLLRFLAALMVVFYHYAFRGYAGGDRMEMPYPWIAPVAQYGYLGVELFFMISGFVILMTASGSTLRQFATSRFVRLYPAFWVCCTLTFLTILVLGGDRFEASPGQFLVNLTMLSGFVHVASIDGVYWSLFVELQFYALVMLLLASGQLHRTGAALGAWMLATILIELWPNGYLRTLLITGYSTYFIAGATCYLMHKHGPSLFRSSLFVASWTVALHQATRTLDAMEQRFHTDMDPTVVVTVISAFFMIMLAVATRSTGAVARRQWTTLGALTYPLYLLHQNIGYMLFNTLHTQLNPHVLFWGMIALMLALAYVVHACVERPLQPIVKTAINGIFDPFAQILRPWIANGTRNASPD